MDTHGPHVSAGLVLMHLMERIQHRALISPRGTFLVGHAPVRHSLIKLRAVNRLIARVVVGMAGLLSRVLLKMAQGMALLRVRHVNGLDLHGALQVLARSVCAAPLPTILPME